MISTRALMLFSITASMLIACSQQPSMASKPASETTRDGLVSVQLSDVDTAWARPDIDLHNYKNIILEEAGIQYRQPGTAADANSPGAEKINVDEFMLSDTQKQQLRAIVSGAFIDELRNSERFSITTTPGPDTLLIRGALLDVVAKKPAATNNGALVYVSEIGGATLMLEIFDAQSGTLLARAIDHDIAGKPDAVTLGNTVTTWTEVKKVAQHWARTLRQHLEAFAQ